MPDARDSFETVLWGLAALFILSAPATLAWRAAKRRLNSSRAARQLDRIKAALREGDPEAAEALADYADRGGTMDAFTAEEIAAGTFGTPAQVRRVLARLSEDQLVTAAEVRAGARVPHEGAELIELDPHFFKTEPRPETIDRVIRLYQRAEMLDTLISASWADRPSGFVLALARGLLRLDLPARAESLLAGRKERHPAELRLLAETLLAQERGKDALDAMERLGRAEWTDEEQVSYFRLALKLGLGERASRSYQRIKSLRPLAVDPALHYEFGRSLEAAGDLGSAAEVYRAFVLGDLAYLDAVERFRSLKVGLAVPPPAAAARPGAPAAPDPAADGPRTIADRYELRRKIAMGGMGIVYESHDRRLDRKVAVKMMRPEISQSDDGYELFLNEARITAKLRHPSIVEIHDILEWEAGVYIILEFIEGKPLSLILKEKKVLPLPEAARVLSGACAAIAFAHGQGVLHRDLKPGNIMLAEDGAVKVMDFGIARLAKDRAAKATNTQEPLGTLAYMAPEQHLGKVSKASDVYALGVCLYETIVGSLPFDGPDYLEQKRRLLYAPPSTAVPTLPKAADILVAAALAPDPDKRIAGAGEFLEHLAGF